jgi:hypothetical protein
MAVQLGDRSSTSTAITVGRRIGSLPIVHSKASDALIVSVTGSREEVMAHLASQLELFEDARKIL